MPGFLCLLAFVLMVNSAQAAQAWWNGEWAIRKKITVDTTPAGGAIDEPIGPVSVLVRLHDGNFQFFEAKPDGSDLRFVAADDKTLLPYHIEKFDSILNEGFVWVRLPDVKPGAQTSFWLYYGNVGEQVATTDDAKATFDADTVLIYHFGEKGAAPTDVSGNGNNAANGGVPVAGSLIGGAIRLTGQTAINIPASPSLEWKPSGEMTWSAWINPLALAPNAVIFSRREGDNAFLVGLNEGVPFVEVKSAAGTERTAPAASIEANTWHHLAVVAASGKVTLYLDGENYGELSAALPALNSPAQLGYEPPADATGAAPDVIGFSGEVDQLEISKVARTPGVVKFRAFSQGTSENAGKLVVEASDEVSAHGGENEIAKHLTLITDISKSLTFDGWVVIGLCMLLAVVGWWVAIAKLMYLIKVKKGSDVFFKEWEKVSADLSVLDHGDEDSIRSMGGHAGAKAQKLMRQSPLYHIYHIGSSEIRNRMAGDPWGRGVRILPARAIQAIRATLDGGLVREVQKLNSHLVFLTIGIAGGPYLGLLGTVIGVMITFAVIAKSGAVEVNSIAPGIAGALLATVAGLVVAIPALFAYSYLSTRIKDAISDMQVFIDEFIAKMAEFYSGDVFEGTEGGETAYGSAEESSSH